MTIKVLPYFLMMYYSFSIIDCIIMKLSEKIVPRVIMK